LYDETIKSIDLTVDERNVIEELLSHYLDKCVSVGEEITVKNLLEKLR